MPTTIASLSSEILSLIFIESLPRRPEVHDGIGRGPFYAAPLIVSWVCKQWRNAALATSILWAGISLCVLDHRLLNRYQAQRAAVAAAKLSTFAERAAGRSLEVAIGCPRVPGFYSSEQFEPIVEALDRLPNRNHIRWLSLQLPGNAIEAFAACAHDRLDFAGVASLSLYFPRLSDGWPIRMFRHFPNILSLTLHHVSLSRLPGLPWSSLTDLFGDRCGIGDAVQIMRQAPNLRRAYFDVLARHLEVHPGEGWNDEDREFGHPPDDTQRVSLDLLESFEVSESCGICPHILEYVRLPAVRSLTLGVSDDHLSTNTEDHDVLHPTVFRNFLTRSGTAHLEELVLLSTWRHADWPEWANDPFKDLGVTEATFGGVVPSFALAFFNRLQHYDAFLPCLRRLEIRCQEWEEDELQSSEGDDSSSEPDSSFEAVLAVAGEAILARNARSSANNGNYPSRIQSFTLLSDGGRPVDQSMLDLGQVTALQSSGVEVVIASEDMSY
uniref:F-box domain-containing protein n=1 Tax=Mycena chlorophos TaxID=658473 RepID=A0ABQ0M5C5_MYCCL|nr:predicted protein [Mycena chlorophos]